MPAVCCSLVIANLYAVVCVAVLQALNIGAGLATQCFSEHAVLVCHVCTGVGVLHVVTPGVQRGCCCASYALHNKGFVIAFDDLIPVYTVQIILTLAVFIPVDGAQVLAYAGGGQSFGNLYLTAQIFAVCGMILIGNLLCQCLQGCFNSILIGHGNAAAVGGQNYAGALVSLSNNGIAGLVVLNLVTLTLMVIDNGFPTAVMSDVQSFGSLGHVKEAFFSLGLAAVDGQALCSSCRRSFGHSQQGHACCFIIGQVPSCTISNVRYDAAVAVNIVAAVQLRVLFVQADFNAAAIACSYITINDAGCFAAVYSNVAAVGIDVTLDVQSAVVGVDIYVSAFACIDCSISTVDNSAAIQGYVAVYCVDTNVAADFGAALNSNICTICLNAGFTLQLQLSLSSIDVDIFIGCFYCCALFNFDRSRVLGEDIRAVFLQYAFLFIFFVIAGDALVELISLLILRISRCRRFRFNIFLIQAALTICFIEGNIAGLQCCGRSSQAISNLHETGQVLLTVYKVAVGQLACQCVQYVVNAVLVVHCNTGVIGNHGYYRAFCRMLDNSVACCVVFSCFAVAGMCVEDIGIATIVIDSKAVAILLEDAASFSFACTANEVSDFTAGEFIFFPFGIAVYITVLLIIPGSTVCHSQVHGTAQACIFFCIEMFVCDAGPCGIFGGQLQVDNRFLAVAGKFLALLAEEACITLNGNSLALAANINSTQSCA